MTSVKNSLSHYVVFNYLVYFEIGLLPSKYGLVWNKLCYFNSFALNFSYPQLLFPNFS